MFDFLLDKKTLVFIAVCCLALGGLLFFAGVVVGLDRGSHETQARMEKEFAARLAAGTKAETAPEEAESSPDDESQAAAIPEPAESGEDSGQAADSSNRPQLLTVVARPRSADSAEATEAEDAGPEDEADAESEPASDYSLQIGAFRSQ